MISVLVASVGVLGTVLGVTLTAFITARAEGRRQAALERQQIRQELTQRDGQVCELRLEHLRWRRERRQSAYLELLEALNTADRANQQYFRELWAAVAPSQVDEVRLAEIRRLFKDSERVHYKVVLEGPAEVGDIAQKVIEQFSTLIREVRDFAQAQADTVADLADRRDTVEATGRLFMALESEFLDTARTALDEIIDFA